MALRAVRPEVRAGEREPAEVVIEGCALPLGGSVALAAGPGKVGSGVVRIRCAIEGLEVTGLARGRRAGKASAHVTEIALLPDMSAGESKAGPCFMIEGGALPLESVVARRAVARKSGLGVVGVPGGRELDGMAGEAVGWSSGEAAPNMAGAAIQPAVCAGEGEAGHRRVIEPGPFPGIHGVALVTLHGEGSRRVRRRRSLPVVLHVAGETLRAEPNKNASAGALVAILTGRGGVAAGEGEAVEVFTSLTDGAFEALHGVALLAIRAELLPVNVGMAGGAFAADAGEYAVDVAGTAGHGLMSAAQRVAGLGVVVEFRALTDGPPAGGSVAAFASDPQGAVGVGGSARSRLLARRGVEHCAEERDYAANLHRWHSSQFRGVPR